MSSLKKNFFYNLIYQLLLIVLPLLTIPYISRVLGANNIGVYSYTFSIANLFLLLSMLGLKNYGSRSIARSRENNTKLSVTFWNIYSFQFIFATLIMLFYLISVYFYFNDYFFLMLLQAIFLASGIFDISWFYFGIEKFKITVTRGMFVRILSVISIFMFVKDVSDLWIYILIQASSILFMNLSLWIPLFRFIKFKMPTIQNIKIHIKPNFTLFLPVLAVSVYQFLSKVLLGELGTMEDVGNFELSERMISIPFTLITALGTVMIPRMSNMLMKGERNKSEMYISLSMTFIMFIGSGMAFGIFGISNVVGVVFFGEEYTELNYLIAVLSFVIIFKAWANVIRTQYLIPTLQDKKYILSVFVGAIVNILFNIVLIPMIGAMGTVISLLLTESSVAIVQSLSVRKELDLKRFIKDNIQFVLIGALMSLAVMYIGSKLEVSIMTLLIQIIVGFLLYSILSIIYLKIYNRKMYNYLFKALFSKTRS